MMKKAKPDFAEYGIILDLIGDNSGDIVRNAHTGKHHYVGDSNTLAAAKSLIPADAKIMEFSVPPQADSQTVALIEAETAMADCLIAVGSGTLNDLCKMASYNQNKPYSVIATAPSMNGYVSANASIEVDGFKQTLAAHTPQKVIADISVLEHAPAELHQAGLGDVLCRSTIQADWLLSHLVTGSPYCGDYFEWLKPDEDCLLENPRDFTALISALFLSGIAMRDYGSSAPASQGEHMIAHTMDMLHPHAAKPFHGQAIAVTTLTMAAMQQKLLTQSDVSLRSQDAFENMPLHMHKQSRLEIDAKFPNAEKIESYQQNLKNWDAICEQILPLTLKTEQVEKAFIKANAFYSAEQLGWDILEYQKATSLARFTRNRFTFLDIA